MLSNMAREKPTFEQSNEQKKKKRLAQFHGVTCGYQFVGRPSTNQLKNPFANQKGRQLQADCSISAQDNTYNPPILAQTGASFAFQAVASAFMIGKHPQSPVTVPHGLLQEYGPTSQCLHPCAAVSKPCSFRRSKLVGGRKNLRVVT